MYRHAETCACMQERDLAIVCEGLHADTYGSAYVSVTFRAPRGSAPSTGTRRCKKIPCAGECTTSCRYGADCGIAGKWSAVYITIIFFSNAILGCKGNQVKIRKRSEQVIMRASNQSFSQLAPRRLATLVSRTSSRVRLHILHACYHRMKSSIFFCFSAATPCLARIFHTCLFLFIDGIYPSCCQAVGIVGS